MEDSDIKVYGVLHAATGDGVVARAAQIKDSNFGTMQSDINTYLEKLAKAGL